MRTTVTAAFGVLLLAGCGGGDRAKAPEPRPLVTGSLEGGTLWKRPLDATTNEGFDPDKGSRVEVFDQFVVITTPGGLTYVRPHGTYTGLVIKRD